MRTWGALAVTVCVASACGGTSPPPKPAEAPPACDALLVGYRDWPALEASGRAEWSLDLSGRAGGRVVYVGAQHSDDPASPQFAALTEA